MRMRLHDVPRQARYVRRGHQGRASRARGLKLVAFLDDLLGERI